MTEREKITVIIPTFNEERNLPECLATVRWADEIFVVDSFSKDRTPEIAGMHGVRLVQHEYVNSATQKNWAIPRARHPWVLIVDADERVPPELRDEILRTLESPNAADGYAIGRTNFFMGRRIRYSGWQNDSCLRLFRRDKGRYQDRHVHADAIVQGRVGRLRNKLLHNTFQDFDQYMKKFDRYTGWAAQDRARRTTRVRWHHLSLRPIARFLKQYVFKLGFLDGKAGLIISSLAAYSVFMKYAKLWEMRENQSIHRRARWSATDPSEEAVAPTSGNLNRDASS
jgi:glycosyltransferase involved in cell wall biosynthesis